MSKDKRRRLRAVVVGASSGLGRCIGIGLAQRGAHVALLARRAELLAEAAKEAGPGTLAIPCDVTDAQSCQQAVADAAGGLGGIDALVYATGMGPLARLVDLDADTWRRTFATNVTGAALVTAAAVPHLLESGGAAAYLSSVSASMTPPWPGLGAYVVSKAALDKLVDAWRAEHPAIGFTRVIVGDCVGGEGAGMSQFSAAWDADLTTELVPMWMARSYLAGAFVDVEELVDVIDHTLRRGASTSVASVSVIPRPTA